MSTAVAITQACQAAMGWPNAIAIIAFCAFGAAAVWAFAWLFKD